MTPLNDHQEWLESQAEWMKRHNDFVAQHEAMMIRIDEKLDRIANGGLPMTPEEPFERIAQILANVATLQEQNARSIALLTITIDRYVTSANTRMEQMERNLDNLIRIITAEHSNGKRGEK